MREQSTYLNFEQVKNGVNNLEMIAQNKMIAKVNELNQIIENIENNWRGANSAKYRKNVNDINEAIEEFRRNHLAPIVENIGLQAATYEKFEEEV